MTKENFCFYTKLQKKLQAVGGLTKVAIQWELGTGRNMIFTGEMLSLLNTKFSEKSNLLYIFKDISSEDLILKGEEREK